MSKLFNQDNAFFRIMAVCFDLVELNLLTLMGCLPVVTAGASFAAMHNVLWHMVRGEQTYVFAEFVGAFRANIKQASVVWLLCVVLSAVLTADVVFALQLEGVGRIGSLGLLTLAACTLWAVAQYSFVLMSRYRNSVTGYVKNAGLLAFGFLPRTLGMLVVLVVFAALSVWSLPYGVPLIVLFGLSLPQYCCAWLYAPILRRLDGDRLDGEAPGR